MEDKRDENRPLGENDESEVEAHALEAPPLGDKHQVDEDDDVEAHSPPIGQPPIGQPPIG
jgi:hypothetical protein